MSLSAFWAPWYIIIMLSSYKIFATRYLGAVSLQNATTKNWKTTQEKNRCHSCRVKFMKLVAFLPIYEPCILALIVSERFCYLKWLVDSSICLYYQELWHCAVWIVEFDHISNQSLFEFLRFCYFFSRLPVFALTRWGIPDLLVLATILFQFGIAEISSNQLQTCLLQTTLQK